MSYSSRIGTSEQIDLLLSWIVLVIAFSVVGNRRVPGAEVILISAVGVGTGFLLHELAHKFVAQRYGYWAEYRANRSGLLFIIIMSFMGFIFAAPGAVIIHKASGTAPGPAYAYSGDPYGDQLERRARREELRIALAGPMANIILTALFFAVLKSGMVDSRLSVNAAYFAFFINLNLAAFNLLPFGPLDGKRIFEVNRLAWGIVAVPTILMALAVLLGVRMM
jgi:Zn-dependent protease